LNIFTGRPKKKKHTTIYLELEDRNEIGLRAAIKRAGKKVERRLLRTGPASADFSDKMNRLFNPVR
jgi:hypothetical protein